MVVPCRQVSWNLDEVVKITHILFVMVLHQVITNLDTEHTVLVLVFDFPNFFLSLEASVSISASLLSPRMVVNLHLNGEIIKYISEQKTNFRSNHTPINIQS